MSEDKCPVDNKTRDAWLAHARSVEEAKNKQSQQQPTTCPVDHTSLSQPKSWTQTISSYIPWSTTTPSPPPSHAKPPTKSLDLDREVSTIPRTTGTPSACPVDHGDDKKKDAPRPANHEMETGLDPSGNWVYPSEKMFFDAMKRKGYDARVADMKTVVPIHNAVNERAWKEIKEWEAPYLQGTKCDGPKLESFANKNDNLSPTARINTILGFTAPFDRHDWVIDRCGTRVDYVIDFYAGRPDGKGGPSFYLDVRPKLNTWEGVKMRAMRWAWLA